MLPRGIHAILLNNGLLPINIVNNFKGIASGYPSGGERYDIFNYKLDTLYFVSEEVRDAYLINNCFEITFLSFLRIKCVRKNMQKELYIPKNLDFR